MIWHVMFRGSIPLLGTNSPSSPGRAKNRKRKEVKFASFSSLFFSVSAICERGSLFGLGTLLDSGYKPCHDQKQTDSPERRAILRRSQAARHRTLTPILVGSIPTVSTRTAFVGFHRPSLLLIDKLRPVKSSSPGTGTRSNCVS